MQDLHQLAVTSYGMKEGNVLFNNALKTFHLRLCGIGHLVKDHSNSEKENPLLPLHGLLLSIMHLPTDRIAHTKMFAVPVVEHWLETIHRTMSDRSTTETYCDCRICSL